MVGRERLGVVGKVLLKEPGLRKTKGIDMRMTELSGNRINEKFSSRKNSEKGFTLVELIVVLVILAIIAAVAVPVMLGFTDDAREKQYITEAKEALTATQAMISDVYTDNLVYISKSMRDKALETSGLNGDSTEFVVWTEKSFKSADGTFDTYKSYAIASALYVVNGNTFVFYNNGKWEVSDSLSIIGNKAKDGASYSRGAAIYAEDSNYITIWPSDSESANKDTAINKKYADNSDELIDDDENKRHDDSQNYDINKPSKDKQGVTVYISAPKAINNYVPLTVSGGDKYSVALTNSGFKNEVVLSPIDNIHYNAGSLVWKVEGQTFDNLDYVEEYLKSTYEDADSIKDSISVFVKGEIDERTVSVKVGFEALDSNTQTVSFGDGNDSFVEVKYRMANEDIDPSNSFEYTDIHVVSKDPLVIKHDGNWAEKGINGQYIKNGENYIFANASEIKSEVAGLTKTYVDNNVGNDESSMTAAESELKTNGFTFVAPADIYKKVHVRGLLNNEKTAFLGEVKFGSEKVDMFAETFVCNELTKKVYKANGSDETLSKGIEVADSVGNVVNHYSIFTGHEIYIGEEKYTPDNIYKKAKKVKFWNLYDSAFSYDITDELNGSPEKNREQYNCTKEIIEKLYKDSNSSFGEVAEVDMSDLTTKLANNDSGVTPINGIFATLAGGAAKINKIEYVEGTEAPAPNSVYKEACISLTTVKGSGDKLDRENGKYVADVRDELYPAYTVAYSKASSVSGKYDIYVITEDGTDIKVDGSLKQMNNGFSSMVSNDLFGKLETSEVTDMSEMFKDCSALTSLYLTGLNTSSVTGAGMQGMFYNCSSAEEIVVTGFDTSNITDMSYMFYNCKKITSLNLRDFYTGNVEHFNSMFEMVTEIDGDYSPEKSNKLSEIYIDNSKFISCETLSTVNSMFKNCDSLKGIDLSGFTTCNSLTDIGYWFYNCKSMDYIDLSNFQTSSNLKTIYAAFYYLGCTKKDVKNDSGLWTSHGCSVFAGNDWIVDGVQYDSSENAGNSKTFDFFRINMYGRTYKNANQVGDLWKGDKRHLAISNYSFSNDGHTIVSSGRTDAYRVKFGYFLNADSEFYQGKTWKTY
ncbi:MAG: BspA family leucine-rich repeat surface protein [Eubacterium sp.]|nr:BspA family leucine-rich repeat surface protein [Eubacterium sp.]